MTMSTTTPRLAIPSVQTILNLMIGGLVGLLIWEVWARVLTKAVLGYPLEPAGLIDAIFNHQFGLMVPWLLREALHYAIGIIGYPVFYYIVSRYLKNWSMTLDALVFATFTAGVLYYWSKGQATTWHFIFWIIVTVFIATRFINKNVLLRDSIVWGTFTWLNALGIMAPIGGLSFYLLGEGGQLSFMSFAGHVIYGAIAVWIFEMREKKAGA
ncbi:MAG: hypothetical protein CFE31_11320 [Rhizobiales bacterium PAR1]|nr:MAG: hypothetical protein CFE31_11320 [Rhizobiales bacterium PAR1]